MNEENKRKIVLLKYLLVILAIVLIVLVNLLFLNNTKQEDDVCGTFALLDKTTGKYIPKCKYEYFNRAGNLILPYGNIVLRTYRYLPCYICSRNFVTIVPPNASYFFNIEIINITGSGVNDK